jgi:hypothetical protein
MVLALCVSHMCSWVQATSPQLLLALPDVHLCRFMPGQPGKGYPSKPLPYSYRHGAVLPGMRPDGAPPPPPLDAEELFELLRVSEPLSCSTFCRFCDVMTVCQLSGRSIRSAVTRWQQDCLPGGSASDNDDP